MPAPTRQRLLEAMIETIQERSYATSPVDAICERAGVRKGSFYHFFQSKAALAVAALEHLWETESQPKMEEIFGSGRPPLARLESMIERWHEKALADLEENGRILGCPYFNIGAETASMEPELTATVRGILIRFETYLERTLREAKEAGSIEIDDPSRTAGCLFSMIEGCCTQARIHNDPGRVRDLARSMGLLIGTELHPALAPEVSPKSA